MRSKISDATPFQSVDFYRSGIKREVITSINHSTDTTLPLTRLLRNKRYKVKTAIVRGNTYLSGDKYRFSALGTYLIHFSLVLLIAGFLLGSYLGFRNPSFVVAEGNIQDVGYNTSLSLRLDSFSDEYWPDGTPKDYRSEVTIYENGLEVKQGTVRVNHPMTYNGIRFFQSFFGPAASLRISDSFDKVIYETI